MRKGKVPYFNKVINTHDEIINPLNREYILNKAEPTGVATVEKTLWPNVRQDARPTPNRQS
jgi:hypothetical protein